MGSANALAAYRLYGGKIPPVSLNVLAYMALVSLDRKPEPSWWEGHEMLAIRCFGRPEPVTKTDLRAVERAITPLFRAGAITTIRHASGHHDRVITARNRLWLEHPAPDEKRRKPRVSTRRNAVQHPTFSGHAPDEKRRTKEKEEKEERDIHGGPVADGTVEGAGAREQPGDNHDFAVNGHPAGAEQAEIERRALAAYPAEYQTRLFTAAIEQLGTGAAHAELLHAAVELAKAGLV